MARHILTICGPDDPIYNNPHWIISPVLHGKPRKPPTQASSETAQKLAEANTTSQPDQARDKAEDSKEEQPT